jgi:hypothetical protein
MLENQCCWQEYYELSKHVYSSLGQKIDDKINLYDLTVEEHNEDINPILDLQSNEYTEIINNLSSKVNSLFENDSNYEIKARAKGLNNIWLCREELEQLGNYLIPQVQQKVFKSFVQVDNIKIYRSEVSNEPDISSWLWHFDNNPQEQVKILIYLTDVEEGCGEFTFLRKNGKGIKVPTSRISYPKKWIEPWENPPPLYSLREYGISWFGRDRVDPRDVARLQNQHGFNVHRAQGKKGTLFLFDNNIIHKATVPKNKYRDVVILQLKPSVKMMSPFIGENSTGNGWQHTTFNKDPSIIEPKEP